MTQTVDANGALHNAQGRFDGHLQPEGDTSTLADTTPDVLTDPRVIAALGERDELDDSEKDLLRILLNPDNDRGGSTGFDLEDILDILDDFEATPDDLWHVTDRLGGFYDNRGEDDTFVVDVSDDQDGGWCVVASYIPGVESADRISRGFDMRDLRRRDGWTGLRTAVYAASRLAAARDGIQMTLKKLTTQKPARPSMARAYSEGVVAHGTQTERKVSFSRDGGETVVEGTIRHGAWTSDAQLAGHDVDPRDAHVRITTSTGLDLYLPFSELAGLHEENLFVLR